MVGQFNPAAKTRLAGLLLAGQPTAACWCTTRTSEATRTSTSSPWKEASRNASPPILGRIWTPAAEIDNSISGDVQKPNIAVDPEDDRYPLASAALTAVSYALFLILAIVLQSAGFRLFLILPALLLAAGLVSLRTLHLRLNGRWLYLPTLVIVVILAGFISALHYWPISPITYGLFILGPAYSLTSLIGALSEGQPLRRAAVEPAVVLLILWGTAVWVT